MPLVLGAAGGLLLLVVIGIAIAFGGSQNAAKPSAAAAPKALEPAPTEASKATPAATETTGSPASAAPSASASAEASASAAAPAQDERALRRWQNAARERKEQPVRPAPAKREDVDLTNPYR